jgi:hypothetical protein
VSLACSHAGGAVSELSLSGSIPLTPSICRLELYGPTGALEFDAVAIASQSPWARVRREFAAAVRSGRPPALDAHRGLELQDLIDRAHRSLA